MPGTFAKQRVNRRLKPNGPEAVSLVAAPNVLQGLFVLLGAVGKPDHDFIPMLGVLLTKQLGHVGAGFARAERQE